jgi:hypothetical protein
MVAVYTIVHLWNYYNAAPWTRDGRVRGDVIQVFFQIHLIHFTHLTQSLISQTSLRTDPNKNLMYYQK